MNLKKIFYIAEFSLPSTSAYSIHVLKICDSFSNFFDSCSLIIPYNKKSHYFKKVKKNYNLKNNFLITSFFRSERINFALRIIFSLKVVSHLYKYKDNKEVLIYSRSILTSIFLSIFQIPNYLELHHDLKGLTKFFFTITRFDFFRRNIKFILLHKNLLKAIPDLNNNYIILDDAVDIEDFSSYKKNNLNNKKNNTCAYFGSLTKGKGLEIIFSIAEKMKNINFHIYTDITLLNKRFITKINNVKFYNHVSYSKVPLIMSKYDVVLMPYQDKVAARSNNLEISKFMSPLKLFDYLASCKIIIASDLKVYTHILRNNFNSILIEYNNINLWCKKIRQVFRNRSNFHYMKVNAYNTAVKYTWDKRVLNIINFYNKN
jgi:glycosyltransferase involved in cell wall biosynthesis